jgi:dolichol-phosphate mannosyltransferase
MASSAANGHGPTSGRRLPIFRADFEGPPDEDERPRYSLVVPARDEEDVIGELAVRLAALMDALDAGAEVILVDDGSTDSTYSRMQEIARSDGRFRLVRLSRNFGHQIAITAGMELAVGDAVIVLDADLQDPPEVVLELVSRWRNGFDIVYAVREARDGETRFKRWTASLFYRLFNRVSDLEMPLDAGDFRLVDRRAVDAFLSMREGNRFVRGMFSWVGFSQTGVMYHREERIAGRSKYTMSKMLRFAATGLVSFSTAPLRIVLKLGLLVTALSFVAGLLVLFLALTGGLATPAWTLLLVAVAFGGGIQLVVLGVIGEYIADIHSEVKRRPLYVVRDLENFNELPQVGDGAIVADGAGSVLA